MLFVFTDRTVQHGPKQASTNPKPDMSVQTNDLTKTVKDHGEVTVTPKPLVVKSVTKPLVAKSVTKPLVVKSVTMPLVAKSVTKPLLAKSVTKPLVAKSVTKPLVVKSVTKPLVVKSVTKPLAAKSVTKPLLDKCVTEALVAKSAELRESKQGDLWAKSALKSVSKYIICIQTCDQKEYLTYHHPTGHPQSCLGHVRKSLVN